MALGMQWQIRSVSDAEIAARAHELWRQRGCPDGDPLTDWYAARAQLERERARRTYEAHVALFE